MDFPTTSSNVHMFLTSGGGVALAYPLPPPVLHHPLERPVRLTGSPDSGSYQTGCRGDSATLRSPGNTPLGQTDSLCRANPLGQPARARAGRTFCDPRTSCGDTNGSTLHVAKQVRGIQNPQSCRQAHRKSHLSSAPIFSMAYPTSSLEKQSGNKTTLP